MFIITPSYAMERKAQRSCFLQAQTALARHDYARYQVLKTPLQNYVLYPYLVYQELAQQLNYADEQRVQNFLQRYADTPLAAKLRQQWLLILAAHGRWNDYLNYYLPANDITLQCYRRLALLKTDQSDAAFFQIDKLWLQGHKLPTACDNVLTAWQQTGALSADLVWARLKLAIQAKDMALIHSLTLLLPASEQPMVKLWQKIYQRPALLVTSNILRLDSKLALYITLHGLQKLAATQPLLAIELWEKIAPQIKSKSTQQAQSIRAIALGMAESGLPQAANWLSLIPTPFLDQSSREWQIRTALAQQNWPQVQRYIQHLPLHERRLPIWQYWLARCYEQAGQNNSASAIFKTLSNKNDFYSILANARIAQPWVINSKKPNLSPPQRHHIEQHIGLQRAYELHQLAMKEASREEWQFTLRQLLPVEKYAAAEIALNWGWYDRAFAAAMASGYQDDLNLRFPLAYREHVLLQAKTQAIDPAWIFAVIRQESAFMSDARSRVGAAGLMQLMPGTAQYIAKQLKEKLFKLQHIMDINLNIRFGSHYLQQLLQNYKGNHILATAAYNAGPGRVRKWLELRPNLMSDVWIETIPWRETRNYVKNVLTFQAIYQLHLHEQQDMRRLRQPIVD